MLNTQLHSKNATVVMPVCIYVCLWMDFVTFSNVFYLPLSTLRVIFCTADSITAVIKTSSGIHIRTKTVHGELRGIGFHPSSCRGNI